MEQPLPTRRKILDLVGEAQINADGVNRQEELARCLPGETVTLQPGRTAGPGPARITVLSARNVPIGVLTDQYAAMLAPLLARGRRCSARLHCLRGGVAGYPNYGARISVVWDGRPEYPHLPLDEGQLAFRRNRRRRRLRWQRERESGRSTAVVALLTIGMLLLLLLAARFLVEQLVSG